MTTPVRQPTIQPSTAPTTKVTAGGAAGAVTVVLVYILGLFDLTVPGEVGSALTVIFSFAAGYLVKDRPAANPQPEATAAG